MLNRIVGNRTEYLYKNGFGIKLPLNVECRKTQLSNQSTRSTQVRDVVTVSVLSMGQIELKCVLMLLEIELIICIKMDLA